MHDQTIIDFIEAHDIKLTATDIGPRYEPTENDTKRFRRVNHWLVTLYNEVGSIRDIDYGMGDGLRKGALEGSGCPGEIPVAWRECGGEAGMTPIWPNGTTVYQTEAYKRSRPMKPTTEDVLDSLKLDAYAIDQTFEDWCSEYGYDSDSRKAEATYLACLDQAKRLREWLGPKAFAELMECQSL